MSEPDATEVKPTHRCPKCGGTSLVGAERQPVQFSALATGYTARPAEREYPCPVCTPFGPFGLVPEVIAIETALIEETSHIERFMRAQNQRGADTLAWLLEDKRVQCPDCGGSGHWVHPGNPRDKRICYKCNGKGVF